MIVTMRVKISLFISTLAGTVFIVAGLGRAAKVISRGAQEPGSEINVTADKLSSGNGSNQIEATGNVEIKRGGMTLKADEVRMNRATQDTEAKGKVTLDDPEWKVKSADAIQMNLEKEIGEIHNGDLFLEDGHVSLTGRRFEKFGGQTYHVDDGFFTTCLCESGAPSWKFSSEQMDLAVDGVGTIKHGYLYILDVPSFICHSVTSRSGASAKPASSFPSLVNQTRRGLGSCSPSSGRFPRALTQPPNSTSRLAPASAFWASFALFSNGIRILGSTRRISMRAFGKTRHSRSSTPPAPTKRFRKIVGASPDRTVIPSVRTGSPTAILPPTGMICLLAS